MNPRIRWPVPLDRIREEHRSPPIRQRANDTVLVVCSGPSLNKSLMLERFGDIPWCAVSTAIQVFKLPHYWVFNDRPSRDFGPDNGWSRIQDGAITKVSRYPWNKDLMGNPGMILVPYNSNREDVGRTFMDGKPSYLRRLNRSILLAVQFLCREGFTTLIFAGVDHKATVDVQYCHGGSRRLKDERLNRINSDHVLELQILREWCEVAKSKGIRFLSATPEPAPINQFMPPA